MTTDLEARLRGLAGPSDADWDRIRADLGARAAAEGLADVAVESHDSPLGPLLLGATGEGLVRVALPAEDADAVMEDLARRVSPRVLRAPRAAVADARRQLDEYFAGRRRAFDLPLDWRLTAGFRRDVLRATAGIPYGGTASYREVATRAGRPSAVRAAGTALARNPLPIVIPCHRVLRSDGAVGQYLGGAEMKVRLLELERG
ncbi:MAG: methylated-DNA-[protein]-cysteine S-methyltransferase [Miltoncostaeaceae bacterium]|jgi:methylated-DNA-[protein]-cysteine S-methyltransferase|nr:methylated-DNA-[protein]-cysteine S-methyltransferase [Miltoncostaeaceae bacterium]